MSKQLLTFVGVGVAVIGIAIFFVFSSTKGSHLELKGEILKIRTGALDEQNSAAVLDFRVENPSDVPFVVRDVSAKLEKPDGTTFEGLVVARSDMNTLFQYNRFLGQQYNDALTIKDKIAPHSKVDRMVAVRFEVPDNQLESAKAIHLEIQDMDGAIFDTTHAVK
jgi:hypothetical protein